MNERVTAAQAGYQDLGKVGDLGLNLVRSATCRHIEPLLCHMHTYDTYTRAPTELETWPIITALGSRKAWGLVCSQHLTHAGSLLPAPSAVGPGTGPFGAHLCNSMAGLCVWRNTGDAP